MCGRGVHGLNEVVTSHLCTGRRERPRKQVRLIRVSVDIRTSHFSYTNQNLHDKSCLMNFRFKYYVVNKSAI